MSFEVSFFIVTLSFYYDTDLMQVRTRECESSEHSHTRVKYFLNARAFCEGAASRVSTRTFVKLLQKTHSHSRAKFIYV